MLNYNIPLKTLKSVIKYEKIFLKPNRTIIFMSIKFLLMFHVGKVFFSLNAEDEVKSK